MLFFKTIHPRGKDQHKSCSAHHGEPLLCPCLRTTCNFFGYFSGLGNVASPSSNEHGSWWASNIRLSVERRRRNHFTPLHRFFLLIVNSFHWVRLARKQQDPGFFLSPNQSFQSSYSEVSLPLTSSFINSSSSHNLVQGQRMF